MNTWWKRLAIISMFAAGAALAQTGGSTSGGTSGTTGSTPQHQRERQRLLDGHRLDGRNQLGLDGL